MQLATDSQSRVLVQRVADSARFKRSPRLREFLLLVCENHFEPGAAPIHEHDIGYRVYARRADYNPADDNIVRVEARRLRRELSEYFAAEGSAESVVISVPKGSYTPRFETRSRRPGRARGWIIPVFSMILIAVAWLLWTPYKSPPAASASVWPTLFLPAERTDIIVGDAALGQYEDRSRREIDLEEYATWRVPATDQQIAAFESVLVVARILKSPMCPLKDIVVRHARDVAARDLQSDNHILLGSGNSNPWSELFREQRNFLPSPDWHRNGPGYLNRAPRSGEPDSFVRSRETGDQFGVIAFLPNLSGNGHVLILEGTTTGAMEAAWGFLSDSAALSQFLVRHQILQSGGRVAAFEVLLKTRSVGGTPRPAEYVSHRIIPSAQTR